MVHYPLHFEVSAEATASVEDLWSCQEKTFEQKIPCSIPPEFFGPGGGFTPEGLFSLSILNCVIATIKYLCEKHKVSFNHLEGKLKATMDRNAAFNHVLISHVEITLKIFGAKDKETLHHLIQRALEECPISNSIKAGKTYHIHID